MIGSFSIITITKKNDNLVNVSNSVYFLFNSLIPTLRENCPYSEFFWYVFARIRTEYEYFFVFSPNAGNMDQKNSE